MTDRALFRLAGTGAHPVLALLAHALAVVAILLYGLAVAAILCAWVPGGR